MTLKLCASFHAFPPLAEISLIPQAQVTRPTSFMQPSSLSSNGNLSLSLLKDFVMAHTGFALDTGYLGACLYNHSHWKAFPVFPFPLTLCTLPGPLVQEKGEIHSRDSELPEWLPLPCEGWGSPWQTR